MSKPTQAKVRRVRPGEWTEVTQPPATLPTTKRYVPEVRRHTVNLPAPTTDGYAVQMPPRATQHIEVKTSMTDRAVGHTIATVPMLAILAILAPVIKGAVLAAPITALGALTLWFMTFAALWAGSWVLSLLMSAEGIGLIDTLLGWRLLYREQDRRWRHYDRLIEGDDYDD